MTIKEILTVILSSTALTTIITVVFNLLSNKKKDTIENITKERKAWRDQLRGIAQSIEKSQNTIQFKIVLSELKVRINAYGIATDLLFYDSHLWKLINEFENSKVIDDEELSKYKVKFVNLISCLLKYDWERSKSEIKGNTQTRVLIITLFISYVLYSIKWFYNYIAVGSSINNYITYCIIYSIFSAFCILLINYADKWKTVSQLLSYILLVLAVGVFMLACIPCFFQIATYYDFEYHIVYWAPYIALIYCSEIKILLYRSNVRNYIISSEISLGNNVIDKKYRIFVGHKNLTNICTGEESEFK